MISSLFYSHKMEKITPEELFATYECQQKTKKEKEKYNSQEEKIRREKILFQNEKKQSAQLIVCVLLPQMKTLPLPINVYSHKI